MLNPLVGSESSVETGNAFNLNKPPPPAPTMEANQKEKGSHKIEFFAVNLDLQIER
jgi:hypothetical protein